MVSHEDNGTMTITILFEERAEQWQDTLISSGSNKEKVDT